MPVWHLSYDITCRPIANSIIFKSLSQGHLPTQNTWTQQNTCNNVVYEWADYAINGCCFHWVEAMRLSKFKRLSGMSVACFRLDQFDGQHRTTNMNKIIINALYIGKPLKWLNSTFFSWKLTYYLRTEKISVSHFCIIIMKWTLFCPKEISIAIATTMIMRFSKIDWLVLL